MVRPCYWCTHYAYHTSRTLSSSVLCLITSHIIDAFNKRFTPSWRVAHHVRRQKESSCHKQVTICDSLVTISERNVHFGIATNIPSCSFRTIRSESCTFPFEFRVRSQCQSSFNPCVAFYSTLKAPNVRLGAIYGIAFDWPQQGGAIRRALVERICPDSVLFSRISPIGDDHGR